MDNRIRIRLLGAAMACIWGLFFAVPAAAEIKASDGWARATTPGAKVGAAYFTLVNTGAEERKLLKITSPVSDEVSIHRTSITAQGTARMWPMALLAVDAGQTLRLEPGGLHVMFNVLKAPLVAGQKVPLTMKFDGGEAEFTLVLEVRPLVPAADGGQRAY
jgi:copper(I)-binding protein